MSIYMFGRSVSAQEAVFLQTNIVGKTRLEQGIQFKAIKSIAERLNTSMQNAFIVYQNNKNVVNQLNKTAVNSEQYKFNKRGMITERTCDSFGRIVYKDISAVKTESKIIKFYKLLKDEIKSFKHLVLLQIPNQSVGAKVKHIFEPAETNIDVNNRGSLRHAKIEVPVFERELMKSSEEDFGIKLVNKIKKSATMKKFELHKNVIDLIKQKLHVKTVDKQKDLYTKNATKMRIKLLPEIFASIKETRSADKYAGKKKSLSSNKDAINLYSKINGQNRKLVRYMLLKRNVDGTRMFEVKDIIKFIDKSNSKILKNKSANPEYRSKNAKAYYEHLYQSIVETYGKLNYTKITKLSKNRKVSKS